MLFQILTWKLLINLYFHYSFILIQVTMTTICVIKGECIILFNVLPEDPIGKLIDKKKNKYYV